MKKQFVLIVIATLLVFSVVACGGAEVENTQDNTVNEMVTNEPVEEVVIEEPAVYETSSLDTAYAIFLADMEGYNTISLDALNTAMAEEAPFILDVRTIEEVTEKGHIPGSVLIPLQDLAKNLAYLPSLDTPIVSYCGSGWRCTIASTALEAMGWEDVTCLKGGSFGGWVDAGYEVVEGLQAEAALLNAVDLDPAMVAYWDTVLSNMPAGYGGIASDALNTELLENPELIVMDVRTEAEIASKGYIEADNWLSIPLETFIDQKASWPTDLNAAIVINCGSGHRSTQAMTMLWSYGYTNVRSLKGGFGAWVSEGYPVIYQAPDLTGALDIFLADMEGYNTISLEALNVAMAEEAPFILDVRNPSEAEENGHIPGAVLIPLRDLAKNLAYLPSFDTPIVSYCGSGWRCTIALTALEALGWEDVKCLKGGSFTGWKDAGYEVAEGLPPEAELLNAAKPYGGMIELWDGVLSNIPDGYGGISAEAFNTKLIETPDVFVIDVRTESEIAEKGFIEAENWLNIPLQEFADRVEELPTDLDTPIVIYCGSGHRSTIAMTILWSYGFSDVMSLKSGFAAWVDSGYPVAELATMP